MKSARVQYLQYLHISTSIYTARRRGSLGSSTLQLPAGPEATRSVSRRTINTTSFRLGRELWHWRAGGPHGSPSGERVLGWPSGPAAGALSGAVVVGTGRRGRRRVHVGCCGSGGGGGGRVHRWVVVVVRVRVRVRVRVVAVAAQAWQRVGRRPALGPEVVVVGGGRVLVGMVVQRLGRARSLQAQIGVRGTVAASGSAG